MLFLLDNPHKECRGLFFEKELVVSLKAEDEFLDEITWFLNIQNTTLIYNSIFINSEFKIIELHVLYKKSRSAAELLWYENYLFNNILSNKKKLMSIRGKNC